MKKRRFMFDKLCRDKTLDIYNKAGATCHVDYLKDDGDYVEALAAKVAEELDEVFSCETQEDLLRELADFEDVFQELKNTLKISQDQLEALKKDKRDRRGGFEKRIYFKYVDVAEGSEEFKYLESDPEKYPEVPLDD